MIKKIIINIAFDVKTHYHYISKEDSYNHDR